MVGRKVVLEDSGKRAEIVDHYRQGFSMLEMARQHGVSAWSIRNVLSAAGETINSSRRNPRNRTPIAKAEEAHALYVGGLNLQQVGDKIGLSDIGVLRVLRRHYPESIRPNSGPGSSRWRGGRMIESKGYARVWIDPSDPMAVMKDKGGYVSEHRLILARKIGRPIRADETVHHIDGDRMNNDPANLELRQGRHGKHVAMCCLDCGSRNIGHAGLGNGG
jgi:lambda repressor-like predicted transcriptional regulator